jgi:two-component system sensor histidine kinase DctS
MAQADSPSLQNSHILWQLFKQITRSFTDRRFSLWIALVVLVVALLVTLVWLAGRYEASQYQDELDRDTADAASEIRNGFDQNVLILQNLHAKALSQKLWQAEMTDLLSQNRDWLRVEK